MDRNSIDTAIATVLDRYGRIDVLLNNGLYAGPAINQPFDQITMEGAEDAFRGCVVNQIHITRRCMPAMIKQGEGRVFFMSSAASLIKGTVKPKDGGWAMLYGAAKSALNRVGEFLHLEHADDGIMSFLVHPNFTLTETMKVLWGDTIGEKSEKLTVHQPHETGDAIAWLADHPDAKKYAGPKLISAPDFFKSNGIDPKAA
jgi:NAD(P)-dependent dehydrogenase (short-subunit alcohol dehydrogenase family)